MALTVVIVDDDAGFRRVARRLLEHGGLEVVGEAADGAGARAACARHRPDGVLLDVHLPDASGHLLAGELAAAGARVLLTSSDSAAAGAGGRVPFIPKEALAEADLRRYFTPY